MDGWLGSGVWDGRVWIQNLFAMTMSLWGGEVDVSDAATVPHASRCQTHRRRWRRLGNSRFGGDVASKRN